MDYLPICIDLRGRACLVVGGGPVALRKIALLLEAGAEVRIVAPELTHALQELSALRSLPVQRRPYATNDLHGVHLVIAATDVSEVNARVAADAKARALPVNVVDSPELCSFIMPAIVDRSPIAVAVSTAGASPVLARLVRAQIETALPPTLGALAEFAAQHRELVRQALPEPGSRRAFWEQLFEGDIGRLVLEGRELEANVALQRALSRGVTRQQQVALIAAGDSDPDRLAVDAVRWLGRADVVLHESAVGAALLRLARRDAERVDIQALSVAGGWSLQMLTDAIVTRVGKGERVCLLRVGDPYARGAAEEALWLRTEGVGVLIFRPSPARLDFLGNIVSELDL